MIIWRYALTFLIVISIVAWMLTGNNNITKIKKAPEFTKFSMTSEAKTFYREEYTPLVSISGKIEAKRSIFIKSQISGKVDKILPVAGNFVKKNDLIVKISSLSSGAELKKNRALLEAATIEHNANIRLADEGLISELGYKNSKAKYEAAVENFKLSVLNYRKTNVQAPFSGYIGNINVKKGENVEIGTRLFDLSSDDGYIVKSYVSAKDVKKIKIGMSTFAISDNNIQGEVISISKIPEENTGTYLIEIELFGKGYLNGDAINIKIETDTIYAHRIPSSLLTIDLKGNPGIKIVNNNNIVEFARVNLLSEDIDKSWIAEINNEISIITKGAGFSKSGSIFTGRIKN